MAKRAQIGADIAHLRQERWEAMQAWVDVEDSEEMSESDEETGFLCWTINEGEDQAIGNYLAAWRHPYNMPPPCCRTPGQTPVMDCFTFSQYYV